MHNPRKGKILVVDDDREIRDLLSEYLQQSGYDVCTAADGIAMFECFDSAVDLLILDLNLPGEDGFSLCHRLRHSSETPIIMLTASSDEADRVAGLEIGADDYIAKPFSPRELLARIKALLRRMRRVAVSTPRLLRFDRWRLDLYRRVLSDEDENESELSGADFALLKLLLDHPNRPVDRDTIARVTRGRESSPSDRSIDVQMSRLRQRLGDDGKQPRLIKTVRGKGYLLAADVEAEG